MPAMIQYLDHWATAAPVTLVHLMAKLDTGVASFQKNFGFACSVLMAEYLSGGSEKTARLLLKFDIGIRSLHLGIPRYIVLQGLQICHPLQTSGNGLLVLQPSPADSVDECSIDLIQHGKSCSFLFSKPSSNSMPSGRFSC
ncbi:hypothetical protein TNCV_3993801 [Trichonephila clavipes]|uniref:Uncharacterized protein n=1 Tax=Trichonephila clavipes TaxID=2585209 RepID=A0A8X6T6E5_TRICX|nr:hypothetical protein TNCV_3993801 [Trichonephila clavipes]